MEASGVERPDWRSFAYGRCILLRFHCHDDSAGAKVANTGDNANHAPISQRHPVSPDVSKSRLSSDVMALLTTKNSVTMFPQPSRVHKTWRLLSYLFQMTVASEASFSLFLTSVMRQSSVNFLTSTSREAIVYPLPHLKQDLSLLHALPTASPMILH